MALVKHSLSRAALIGQKFMQFDKTTKVSKSGPIKMQILPWPINFLYFMILKWLWYLEIVKILK